MGLARLRQRQGDACSAKLAEARSCLRGVYARFTEGFAFPDLREAAGLIGESLPWFHRCLRVDIRTKNTSWGLCCHEVVARGRIRPTTWVAWQPQTNVGSARHGAVGIRISMARVRAG